jgi:hypothetical protein
MGISESSREALNFCSRCGGPLGNYEISTSDWKIHWSDVDEIRHGAFNESLADYTDRHAPKKEIGDTVAYVLISNRKSKREMTFQPKYTTTGIKGPEPDIAAEKAVMAEQFKEEIAKFRELFGSDNVSIEWGVIVDAS